MYPPAPPMPMAAASFAALVCRVFAAAGGRDPAFKRDVMRTYRLAQETFVRVKPPGRARFLDKYFVLHRILQLKVSSEHLALAPAIRDPARFAADDRIWQRICDACHWEYVPLQCGTA